MKDVPRCRICGEIITVNNIVSHYDHIPYNPSLFESEFVTKRMNMRQRDDI